MKKWIGLLFICSLITPYSAQAQKLLEMVVGSPMGSLSIGEGNNESESNGSAISGSSTLTEGSSLKRRSEILIRVFGERKSVSNEVLMFMDPENLTNSDFEEKGQSLTKEQVRERVKTSDCLSQGIRDLSVQLKSEDVREALERLKQAYPEKEFFIKVFLTRDEQKIESVEFVSEAQKGIGLTVSKRLEYLESKNVSQVSPRVLCQPTRYLAQLARRMKSTLDEGITADTRIPYNTFVHEKNSPAYSE